MSENYSSVSTPSTVGPEHLTTLITFDLGGEWQPIQPPRADAQGNPITCRKVTTLTSCRRSGQPPITCRKETTLTSRRRSGQPPITCGKETTLSYCDVFCVDFMFQAAYYLLSCQYRQKLLTGLSYSHVSCVCFLQKGCIVICAQPYL